MAQVTIAREQVNGMIDKLHNQGCSIFGINEFTQKEGYKLIEVATILFDPAKKLG